MFLKKYVQKRNSLITVGGLLVTTLLVFGLGGCGNKTDAVSSAQQDPKQLLASDLQTLQTQDVSGLSIYDAKNQGLITQIFGGTTNQALLNYLNARLHYFVLDTDPDVSFSRSDIFDQNYEKDPTLDNRMKDANAVLGAANIGMGTWMAALVAQVPVTFINHGSYIDVDSSRVGIMLIGEGYIASYQSKKGNTITIPSISRQSILIHEARHSDCTGGIDQATLTLARNSGDAHAFSQNNTQRACGHLHTYCPAGNQYADLPACDSDPWGAYAIQAIFDRAMLSNTAALSTSDWEYVNADAIDSESRATIKQTTTPDMSSGGLND